MMILPSTSDGTALISALKTMLTFCGCPREADVFHYQGVELHLLCIDELTSFTEFQYDYLRSRLRCAIPVPPAYRHKIPGIVTASNPGGIGHGVGQAVRFLERAQLAGHEVGYEHASSPKRVSNVSRETMIQNCC